jgi:hypothetical protein
LKEKRGFFVELRHSLLMLEKKTEQLLNWALALPEELEG